MTEYMKLATKLIEKNNDEFLFMLKYIYDFKALTKKQIASFHSYETKEDFAKCLNKVNRFIKKAKDIKIIKESLVWTRNESAYMLEPNGVRIVQSYHSVPKALYSEEEGRVIESRINAKSLSVSDRLLPHHCETIEFLTTFLNQKSTFSSPGFAHKFYLESEMCKSNKFFMDVRPDAIISLFDSYIFIETDMSTESKKQLREKWTRYRHFLSSTGYKQSGDNIFVFMTVSNTDYLKSRIETIKLTICEEILDLVDHHFDVFVGTTEELMPILFNKVIRPYIEKDESIIDIGKSFTRQGFKVDYAVKLQELFPKSSYDLYVRKLDEDFNIPQNKNNYLEFLVDDYSVYSLSCPAKIMYMDRNNIRFNKERGAKIRQIMVVSSEQEIYEELFHTKLLGREGVFFTTKNRLNNLDYPSSIFTVDNCGNVFTFKDEFLEIKEFEKTVFRRKENKLSMN